MEENAVQEPIPEFTEDDLKRIHAFEVLGKRGVELLDEIVPLLDLFVTVHNGLIKQGKRERAEKMREDVDEIFNQLLRKIPNAFDHGALRHLYYKKVRELDVKVETAQIIVMPARSGPTTADLFTPQGERGKHNNIFWDSEIGGGKITRRPGAL